MVQVLCKYNTSLFPVITRKQNMKVAVNDALSVVSVCAATQVYNLESIAMKKPHLRAS